MSMRPAPGSRPRYRGAFGILLALAALPAAAQVGPLTSQSLFFNQASNANIGNYLAANGGVLYTSNAQYTSSGSGDTLLTLGLGGNTAGESARLDYHLASDLMLLKYLGGTFGTSVTGYADGMAAFKIVPGLFSWIARETYTQLQIDPYAPATPDNLESLNYITTGPRFIWSPTLRTSLKLEALYSYISTSSSAPQYVNLDNHRYGGNLSAERAFSSSSSLYIRGRYEKVDFKDQMDNNNFSIADGVGGFRLHGARTDFDISGGYSKIQVEDILTPVETILGTVERPETQNFGGAVWTLNLSRLITPSQRVALFGYQQFTDAAAALRLSFDQPVPTAVPTQLAAGNPFQSRTFGGDWRFETLRSSIDISVLDSRTRYVVITTNENNSDAKSVHALFARQLSPVLNWDIGASYSHIDYAQASTTGQTTVNWTNALTDLRWRVSPRVALRFLYAYSSQNGLHTNQLGIIASYSLLGALPTQQESPQLLPTSPESMQWQQWQNLAPQPTPH
jgi:hypothetical protein